MTEKSTDIDFAALSDAEWRRRLTTRQYAILRRHATEPPGTSPFLAEKAVGQYCCAGCGQPIFSSQAKYYSGTGWPSFNDALPGTTGTSVDRKLITPRTEVHCGRCGGHLGHLFADGPAPTGQRWCINGEALAFAPFPDGPSPSPKRETEGNR